MDPYVGEIRLFAGNYAPAGWAFCEGQTMYVSQNQVLFTIIGNTFGGDGRTTYNLPDLRGLAPMHQGTGTGLTPRPYAKGGGDEMITLLEGQMPVHDHAVNSQTTPSEKSPIGNVWSNVSRTDPYIYSQTVNMDMNAQAIGATGGGQEHNNVQPYLNLSFIIALEGVYPVKP